MGGRGEKGVEGEKKGVKRDRNRVERHRKAV